MEGFIHSIETFGTLDGPGIRMVVFLQGCPLRCKFCHNPDTWKFNQGEKITPVELLNKAVKYKNYYKNGGITFSGGEPLFQEEFLIECLKNFKKEGFHTAVDTSGYGKGDYVEILQYTDLVILDIKGIDKKSHKEMTGVEIDNYLKFKESVICNKNNIWLKQVIIPGINDTFSHMDQLANEIKDYNSELIEKIELLPYHTLGVQKYKELNIKYPLTDILPMEEEKLKNLKKYLKEKCCGYKVLG